MYRGSLAAAQRVLEDARAADPLAPSALMNLVRLHLTAHREELAVPLLHTAAEMNPRLALAHEQLGHAYVLLGQPREARACFRSAAALSGERGDALLAYGLATSGDRSLAKDILQPGAAVGESVAWSGVRYRDGPRRAR